MIFKLTENGKQMEAQLIPGGKPIITKIESSDAYSANEGSLLSVQNKKQDLQIEAITVEDGATHLKFLLHNVGLEQEYTLRQIGIYAKPAETEAEILYIIGQDKVGERIPVSSEKLVEVKYDLVIHTENTYEASIVIKGTDFAQKDELKAMDNKKVNSSGGDISDTVATVLEPDSADNKYPSIDSGWSIKSILGGLYRWTKSLKADKADSNHNHDNTYVKISGGDIKDAKVSEFTSSTANYPVPAAGDTMKVILGKLVKFCSDSKNHNHDSTYVKLSGGDIAATKMASVTASTASYPVPAAGDTGKVFMGKIIKFFNDIRNATTGACFIGQIVNNCTSTDTKKPLSAAQGKALMDLYNGLNTKKLDIGSTHRISIAKTTSSSAILTIPISEIGVSNAAYVTNVVQISSNDYFITRWWYDALNIYAFIRKASDGTIAANTSITVRVYHIE